MRKSHLLLAATLITGYPFIGNATVVYEFHGFGLELLPTSGQFTEGYTNPIDFRIEVAEYLTADAVWTGTQPLGQAQSFSSCTDKWSSCESIYFFADTTANGMTTSGNQSAFLVFYHWYDPATKSQYSNLIGSPFYFPAASISQPGSYRSLFNYAPGVLTVSLAPTASPVSEPSVPSLLLVAALAAGFKQALGRIRAAHAA